MAKDATLLEVGPANVYIYVEPIAAIGTTLTPANSNLRFKAKEPGASGNSITVAYVNNGASKPLAITVAGKAITVQLATDAGSLVTSTGSLIRDAIQNSPQARALIYAVLHESNTGAGIVTVMTAITLSGGSDIGLAEDAGFVDVDTAWRARTEAVPLTAAQFGTIPIDKVISGGSFVFTLPFKQINLENLQRAIPNAVLLRGAGALQRLDFVARVGQSMRALAFKMEIRKFRAGGESARPQDIVVIPEVSPVDGEVLHAYHPTTQRVITGTFEAWPDTLSGRWAFGGDEIV